MTEHIDQHTLEIFVLAPTELDVDNIRHIESHLDVCMLCREQMEQLRKYYNNVQKATQSPPTKRDEVLAEALLARKKLALPLRALEKKREDSLDTYAEIIEPYHRPLAQRIMRYVQIHPVRLAGGFSVAAALVAVALLTFKPTKDANPAYAQAKDGFLIVNNNHGDELWRKHIGTGFATAGSEVANHLERAIDLEDIDGDGTKEVLCIFGWVSARLPLYNLLVCYNPDGTERWNYPLHRTMKLGSILYSDDYRFYHMEAGDFTHAGTIEIIAAARHDTWSPNVLVRLEGKTGKFLSEFWHPGELRQFDHKDLDHDGIDELIYAGQNNRLQRACVVVFDPRTIKGSAPAPDKYYPDEIPPGTEKYYITFPASDMKRVARDITNEVTGVRVAHDGMIEVIVNERGPGAGTLYYYLDSSLTCISVRAADSFTAAHKQLELEGKLSTQLNDDYFEALRKGVMYWDGEKFVDRLAMNKHYFDVMISNPSP